MPKTKDSETVDVDELTSNPAGLKPAGLKPEPKLSKLASIKLVAVLFFLFLLVTSEVFLHSVVGNFNGAVDIRSATSWGTVVQGVFLVIFYIISLYLIDSNII